MGDECYIILNIYCFLQTGLGVTLKPRGIELVSVQVSEILGQKATGKKSLRRRKKINDLPCHQVQELRLCGSGHGDKS